MRITLFVLLTMWGTHSSAQTLAPGDYVVVKGAVVGCEEWVRILDIVQIKDEKLISLVGIDNIPLSVTNSDELELSLISGIEEATGKRPKTLTVEVLKTELEYKGKMKEYIQSLAYLLDGTCRDPEGNRKLQIEKQFDKLRREDLSRTVV